MDDSQSSDFLSESTADIFLISPTVDPAIMNIESYLSLVLNTKSGLQKIPKEIKKATFSGCFLNLLEDCNSCISQSLDMITTLLSEANIQINKLIEYLNDAASILQLLSDLIKNVIESISMPCSAMKTFPTVTGHIILLVFTHCRDSELVYGSHLSSVEKYLKDLFRICHELQLTYLIVLEKHYIFDLTEKEEQEILIEALDMNLKIGEIVQSLDVKTMAEQWKAYTVICEKYSSTLMDKNIHSDCTKILCTMVTNNINTALEENLEEKVILRSLKVSSFILKILLRVCITFKNAVVKDYDSIIELLLYVNLNNDAYLHTIAGKTSQFICLFNNNVSSPVHTLLGELLYDNKLLQCICDYDIHKIRRDDKLLGLILLVISTIRSLLQKGGDQLATLQKHRLVNVIYSLLPSCHIWFNMGLSFKCLVPNRDYQTYGLYEHLLTHTVTLASMMIIEEIHILEKRMIEALLGTDCTSAMFTSNLWVLLARMSSRQLVFAQVVSLSEIYQKLENNPSFLDSPQKVHLSHTIGRIFETISNEDKMRIYNMFNICDVRNFALWSCLKIRNLPNEAQCYAEEMATESLLMEMPKVICNEHFEMDSVIKTLHLARTCSRISQNDEVTSLLIEAWTKACPNNMQTVKQLHSGTLWYYRYIEALVAITETMEHIFDGNSIYLVKVLHIISNIVHGGCQELNLLLIDIQCKLATIQTHDMNKHVSESILVQTFSELFSNTDSTVRNKLFNTLRKYKDSRLNRLVSAVVNKDELLKEAWTHFMKHGRLKKNSGTLLKVQLLHTMNFEYCHKCTEHVVHLKRESVSLPKSLSSNFDLLDVDSLFEPECDEEPAHKKAKLNINEAEDIISRLETDISLLSQIKENVFTSEHKCRIKTLCNKLSNITH